MVIGGLRPGTEHEYQVALDGAAAGRSPVRNSRRVSAPRTPASRSGSPSVLPDRRAAGPAAPSQPDPSQPDPSQPDPSQPDPSQPDPPQNSQALAGEQEHGPDALVAYALDLRETPRERWPDLMPPIGDQVYADEVRPCASSSSSAGPSRPPGYQVADFTQYSYLYREAWSEPSVRWPLSVVPTAMIFDDHDVHDDWNISASWRRDYPGQAVVGGPNHAAPT